MLAVVDTNIFINGILFGEKHCKIVLNHIENENITPVFSQETIGELIYVFKNFITHTKLPEQLRLQYLYYIIELFYHSKSINTESVQCPDINDVNDKMFLKIAYKKNIDYIITDDKKSGLFDKIDNHKKYKTITSKRFSQIYKKTSRESQEEVAFSDTDKDS